MCVCVCEWVYIFRPSSKSNTVTPLSLGRAAPSPDYQFILLRRSPRGLKLFTQWWTPLPPTEIVRTLTVVHDYTGETSWFVQLTAIHFAKSGFAVCAIDHRGHGFADGLVVHIPDINLVVDDCISFFDSFRANRGTQRHPTSSTSSALYLLLNLPDLHQQRQQLPPAPSSPPATAAGPTTTATKAAQMHQFNSIQSMSPFILFSSSSSSLSSLVSAIDNLLTESEKLSEIDELPSLSCESTELRSEFVFVESEDQWVYPPPGLQRVEEFECEFKPFTFNSGAGRGVDGIRVVVR